MKNQAFRQRLGFAWNGFRTAFYTERSLRLQVIAALALFPLMIILQPALIWWALVIAMTTLVLAAELFNTALEYLADHLHPEIHPRIRLVKDCAAGAVLLLSVGSAVIGGLMVLSVIMQ